jgi:uncharacterized protein (TIGR03083 family)
METPTLRYDPIAVLHEDSTALLDLVDEARPDLAVPGCPGWTLADLTYHVGEVWDFWATVVSERVTDREAIRAVDEPMRPPDGGLVRWAAGRAERLLASLTATDRSTEVWTWTGANRDVAWVCRRMAQESAVHRWDAEQCLGTGWSVPALVAADGVDEFLMWHAGYAAEGSLPVDGTVHLHCTDTDGEWLVRNLGDGTADFDRAHAKGDAAVRGPAADLLLWCWRRPGGPVEVLGDAAVAERFQAFTSLD